MDELNDQELDSILKEWKVPGAPAHLRAAVFPASPPWWKSLWTASFRIPVPVACLLGAILAFIGWRVLTAAQRVEIRTQRIEVPIVQKPASNELRPVTELRPIIIRSRNDQN